MADEKKEEIPWYQKGLDILGESASELAHAKVKQVSDKWTNPKTHQQTDTPPLVDQYGNNVPYPLRINPDLNKDSDFFESHKALILGGGAAFAGLLLLVVVMK